MEIVKRNLLSIICGAVALLAVVSIFFPMEGLYDDLGAKLEASKGDWDKIQNQKRATFTLPIVVPDSVEAVPFPEGAYPYPKVIEEGTKVVAELARQANELVNRSRQYNKHEPLVVGALPAGGGSERSTFKNRYYYRFEDFKKQLNATAPPTEDDFAAAIADRWEKHWKPQIPLGPNGQPLNSEYEQLVKQQADQEAEKIPEQIKRERAQKGSIYIARDRPLRADSPDRAGSGGGRNYGRSYSASSGGTYTFDYHPGIPPLETSDLPDPVNIWAAQLSLWIQEDVVNAIDDTNVPKDANGRPTAPPPNVEEAIVKRLVRITVPKEYVTRTGPLSIVQAAQQGQANPVPSADGTTEDPSVATKSFNSTPTGRVNNPVYDVMHFQVVVDVDARHFRTFMANLTRNRFVTILKADVKAVDRERALQANYYYGPAPVVQLTLRCEAIFFRDWTVPLMPREIRTLLQIPDPSQQQAVAENQ